MTLRVPFNICVALGTRSLRANSAALRSSASEFLGQVFAWINSHHGHSFLLVVIDDLDV